MRARSISRREATLEEEHQAMREFLKGTEDEQPDSVFFVMQGWGWFRSAGFWETVTVDQDCLHDWISLPFQHPKMSLKCSILINSLIEYSCNIYSSQLGNLHLTEWFI